MLARRSDCTWLSLSSVIICNLELFSEYIKMNTKHFGKLNEVFNVSVEYQSCNTWFYLTKNGLSVLLTEAKQEQSHLLIGNINITYINM